MKEDDYYGNFRSNGLHEHLCSRQGKWERFSCKKQREDGRADFGAGYIPCIGGIRGIRITVPRLQRLEFLTKQLAKEQGVTEELKEKAPMQWVQAMNAIRSQAEEVILEELIYN